jgi:hypothetical protein
VDFHLDHEVRLCGEPGKSWAINEIDAEGKRIGNDQIPWEWSFNFTATSCVLADSVDISRPLDFKFNVTHQDGTVTEEAGIARQQVIRLQLRPGHPRENGNYWRQTTFSMFGTDRAIKKFQLDIYPLAEPAEQDHCTAWGSVSYTTDIDFRKETMDDCIVFNFFVRPDTFASYVTRAADGSIDEVILRIGGVDGFYSEWSPSISTRNVKVLTAYKEHKVTVPTGHQIEPPPRLGVVRNAELYINRRIEFSKPASATEVAEEAADDETQPPVPETHAPAPSAPDQRVLQLLQSLRRAAWFIVGLLALIFIATISRH